MLFYSILFYSILFYPVSTNYEFPNTVRKHDQDMNPVPFNDEAFKLAEICDLRFTAIYTHTYCILECDVL